MAARETRLPDDFSRGTIYMSEETHYCVPKAARIAGFRDWQVRRMARSTRRRRIDTTALAHAIEMDRTKGLKPFLIIANVGTTNTGAIDDIPRLLSIGRSHSMWVHADAAYGGFFRLASGRARTHARRSRSATRSPSTRTRGCSCPTAPGACSSAIRRP